MKIGDKVSITLEVVEVRESSEGKSYMLKHPKADWITNKLLVFEKDLEEGIKQ